MAAALPSAVKELVVQWPRAGKRRQDGKCVSVARLTLVDHQGVITTLGVEAHEPGTSPAFDDYRVVEDDGMPRAVFTTRPAPSTPNVLISLSGPAGAARDSLERSLEFVPIEELALRVGAL